MLFSLVLLDLDGFKEVNDAFGHMVGDIVLKRVARIFSRTIREVDVACRIGGDEFAIHLPETDRGGALVVADRLRQRVEVDFAGGRTGGQPVRVTLSGGLAVFPEDGKDPSRLLDRADRSLYEAKRTGRNRVVVYHSEKRAEIRYPFRRTIRVRLAAGASGERIPARGVNLSRSGALVETTGTLETGGRVRLSIGDGLRLAARSKWEGVGQVVRVEPPLEALARRRLAIRFDRPVPEDRFFGYVLSREAPAALREGAR